SIIDKSKVSPNQNLISMGNEGVHFHQFVRNEFYPCVIQVRRTSKNGDSPYWIYYVSAVGVELEESWAAVDVAEGHRSNENTVPICRNQFRVLVDMELPLRVHNPFTQERYLANIARDQDKKIGPTHCHVT